MKLSDKYYGYPIFTIFSDDYNGEFSVKFDVANDQTNENIIVSVRVTLENSDFLELLELGKVSFIIHIEESKTCFRQVIEFNSLQHIFTIPFGKVRESIEVNTFIVSKEKINNFSPLSLHDFYKNSELNYDENQIIGFANYCLIEVEKKIDEISDSASIFSIIPDRNKDAKTISIQFTEERVVILMPQTDYEIYRRLLRHNTLKNRHKEILLSNLVMPIMVEILQNLREEGDVYSEKIWYKSIIRAYQSLNIDIVSKFRDSNFSSYYYSQIVFDSVISKSLNQLETLVEGGF